MRTVDSRGAESAAGWGVRRRAGRISTVSAVLASAAAAAAAAHADVTATRTLEESVPVERGSAPLVIVKNVFGSVRVTTHTRNSVDMTATETITGDLQADIDRARAEVELRTESEPGRVAFRVRHMGESAGRQRYGWDDYIVKYEIEIKVPQDAAVDLSTVNGGDVIVEGVHGMIEASNVNGGVRVDGARAAAQLSTVNGPIDAVFERAPGAAATFNTVNGLIDVALPDDTAADLQFRTLHGDIYTDFDVTPVDAAAPVSARRDGRRFVARMDRARTLRIGAGGRTHSFHTVNGEIYVRKGAR